MKCYLEQNATMEWQIVGYCLIPFSVVEAFASNIPKPNPVCKMALKSKGCSECRLRSCCDLAERNARLFLQGKINAERFEELSDDLNNTCEIAFMYQNWLLSMIKNGDLPLTSKRLHTRFKERKKIVQTWV
jgi:hypothetical protein